MRWLVTIVVIAIVAFFGYRYYYTDSGQEMAQQVEQTAEQATQKVEKATEDTAKKVEQATDTAKPAADTTTDTANQAADTATDTANQAADTAGQATAALTEGGIDLGQEIGTTVSDATSALQGITDKASAEAALPSLEAVKTKLDKLGDTVAKLPDTGREALASLLGDSLPELKDLANKVEGMEGAGEVVKPTLDSIMATLEDWAKQPA